MKRYRALLLVAIWLSPAVLTVAQTPTEAASALPRLVRFGGTVRDPGGAPLTGIVGITFALYSEQTGGAALWVETQNITADTNGHYTALLGATKPEGLPASLFTNEQAHWVGVQVEGRAEQPRVLLVSSPYAFKAGDAETVGGLPPSAFMLAVPPSVSSASQSIAPLGVGPAVSPADSPATSTVTGAGTAGYIPRWTSATNIGRSVLFQSGTGSSAKVGINTTAPAATLDINGGGNVRGTLSLPATGTATATAGNNSQPLSLAASVYNGGVSTPVAQTFQLQAEPVFNNQPTASGVLSLLYGSGTGTPAETGLSIASNGLINFASGQTFPGAGGAGTVTSVASGAGLTGGPITSSGTLSIATGGVTNGMLANPSLTVAAGTDLTVNGGGSGLVALGGSTTLSLDTTKVPQLSVANTFTANQTVNGSVSATSFSGNGSALTNLQGFNVQGTVATAANALALNGLPSSSYASLGANTFSATQSINSGDVSIGNGNLDLPNSTSGAGVVNMGGAPFIHQCCSPSNVFVGVSAGNFSNPGSANTGIGENALAANNGGTSNTATGSLALSANTTASDNTANGYAALAVNSTGSENTAVGYQALLENNSNNNTAIGYFALRNNTSGSNNIGIGNSAGANITTTSNNIYIGNQGVAGDNNVIRIGTGTLASTYMAGVSNNNISGFEVLVNSNGQLGVATSSRRYKEDIQDMADASSGLLRLRPVTFRYKNPFSDGSQPVQYGLIAEEVAEVYPDLVARSADGQIETVRYQVLGPMLLNELQKQNSAIAAQKEQIQAQKQQIHSLEERLARVEAALQSIPVSTPSR